MRDAQDGIEIRKNKNINIKDNYLCILKIFKLRKIARLLSKITVFQKVNYKKLATNFTNFQKLFRKLYKFRG